MGDEGREMMLGIERAGKAAGAGNAHLGPAPFELFALL